MPPRELRVTNNHLMTVIGLIASAFSISHVMQFEAALRKSHSPLIQPLPKQSSDYALAQSESFGFFDDISEDRWRIHQKIYNEYSRHRHPDKPLTYNPGHETRKDHWWNSAHAWYQNNYEPNFSCELEKRIYSSNMNGDGGKWVCDPHRISRHAAARKAKDPNNPGCIIYSIGSNGDFGFELGMQQEVGEGVCEYHIFDMGDYEAKMPERLKRAHYHRWGLKKQDGASPTHRKPGDNNKFLGLKDTIKELGHENVDMIDVFKIDCDDCEWEIYTDFFADGIPHLHQILIEVHKAPGQKALDFFDSMENNGYLIYHKEPNIQFGGADDLEYAFVKVKKSFVETKVKEVVSSDPHDLCCAPFVIDN